MNNKKLENVNIKIIAKKAGVSLSTVSRALRDHPETSKRTAKRIKRIAKKLNYYPNIAAKSLRINKSNTIGVIFNDMNNPFYNDVLLAIYDKLDELNYSIIIAYSNWSSASERKNIISLLSRKVDGIIMTPIDEELKNRDLILRENIKTVFVDVCPIGEDVCYSGSNHQKALYIATEYLIKNGHHEIIFYSALPLYSYTKQFIAGYYEALKAYDIPIKEELIITLESMRFEDSYNEFKKIIKNKKNFTAVVTIGDIFAISIYKATYELGLSIPNDFSIASYDNIEFVSALKPPLTTVNQSRKAIGENAVRILLNSIRNKKEKANEKFISSPSLVIRKSVKKIN